MVGYRVFIIFKIKGQILNRGERREDEGEDFNQRIAGDYSHSSDMPLGGNPTESNVGDTKMFTETPPARLLDKGTNEGWRMTLKVTVPIINEADLVQVWMRRCKSREPGK